MNVPNTEYPGIIKVERRLFKTEYSVHNSKSISVCGTHITTQLDIHTYYMYTYYMCTKPYLGIIIYKLNMYMYMVSTT